MHCGPVRHRVTAGSDLSKTLLIHPTRFATRDDIDADVPRLLSSVILPALVTDEQRTRQVCADVAEAVRRGRNCLVLTGRTGHVSAFVTGLQSHGLSPLAAYGSLKPKERQAVLDQLGAAPAGGPPLLAVATDRYIGEGFDCPLLDTLFLAFPVSSEGPMTQYVGRILREHPGKLGVEGHDYADTKIPMLARMHGKRLTTYRRLGFAAAPATAPPGLLESYAGVVAGGAARATLCAAQPGNMMLHRPTASCVRAWARSTGLEVPARGRLSSEILSAYQQAHPDPE